MQHGILRLCRHPPHDDGAVGVAPLLVSVPADEAEDGAAVHRVQLVASLPSCRPLEKH